MSSNFYEKYFVVKFLLKAFVTCLFQQDKKKWNSFNALVQARQLLMEFSIELFMPLIFKYDKLSTYVSSP